MAYQRIEPAPTDDPIQEDIGGRWSAFFRNPVWQNWWGKLHHFLNDLAPSVGNDIGDADATLTWRLSTTTQVFKTALTANRTITLSTTNAVNGARFRIIRTAAATGAYGVSVGGLITLSPGQWCDIEFDGTAWFLAASNTNVWATSTLYKVDTIVRRGYTLFVCLTQHTSGTFATDWLTNSYWAALGDAPGHIKQSGRSTADPGYLVCDGTSLVRADYPDLYAAIGTTYGAADGTHFSLPDFRGIFPKGAGTTNRAAGKDAANNFYTATLGTYYQDKFEDHYHNMGTTSQIFSGAGGVGYGPTGTTGGADHYNPNTNMSVTSPKTNGTYTPRTGASTEPQSLGINFIIKY